MKRLTTIICCVAMMFVAVSAAFMDFKFPSNKTMTAATIPEPLQWNQNYTNSPLPLDLQLDLDKRLSREAPIVKDTVTVTDTVYIDKIQWKTRYKTIAARTAARDLGTYPVAVNPDTVLAKPGSTPNREEEIGDFVGDPKSPSIQLTVDGVIVYQSEDVIHSTEESQ